MRVFDADHATGVVTENGVPIGTAVIPEPKLGEWEWTMEDAVLQFCQDTCEQDRNDRFAIFGQVWQYADWSMYEGPEAPYWRCIDNDNNDDEE